MQESSSISLRVGLKPKAAPINWDKRYDRTHNEGTIRNVPHVRRSRFVY
jgi:hypothetical protein